MRGNPEARTLSLGPDSCLQSVSLGQPDAANENETLEAEKFEGVGTEDHPLL